MSFTLRLTEDRLAPGARLSLSATPRVLYARDRGATLCTGAVAIGVAAETSILRFELVRADATPASAAAGKVESRPLLEHTIALDPARAWLMRCDRVDFAPGGVALPHGHRGGGIRCLLMGELEVTVGERAPRRMRPGDAWFESGREPVLATASADTPAAFVRVSVLPAEIRGRPRSSTSIRPTRRAAGRAGTRSTSTSPWSCRRADASRAPHRAVGQRAS